MSLMNHNTFHLRLQPHQHQLNYTYTNHINTHDMFRHSGSITRAQQPHHHTQLTRANTCSCFSLFIRSSFHLMLFLLLRAYILCVLPHLPFIGFPSCTHHTHTHTYIVTLCHLIPFHYSINQSIN
jgi:hypothetical protein